jgi:hypothetical protein
MKNNEICKIMQQTFLYLKSAYYGSNLYGIRISICTFEKNMQMPKIYILGYFYEFIILGRTVFNDPLILVFFGIIHL